MRSNLGELIAAGRLFGGLPPYLRRPVSPDRAATLVQGWLETREVDFIALVRNAVYARPAHPYRRLLALAGCELGDLETLVRLEGLEAALRRIFEQGVYLTVEEFKGRRPVVRGSVRFEVSPAQLRSPGVGAAAGNLSSGSRGGRTLAPFGLAHLRNRAAAYCVEFKARDGLAWVKGIWDVPGSAVANVLRFSGFGSPLAAWFALVPAETPGLDPRYRWAERALHWGGRLAGLPLPRPRPVAMDQPLPIVGWLAAVLRSGRVPHLYGYLSPVVRLCQVAQERGVDLTGVQFTLTGEPLTPARLGVIQRSGAHVMSRYGSAEAGSMAAGCAAPAYSDDHHVLAYGVALVDAGPLGPGNGLPPTALLVSSLRTAAPFTLINLSTGDQAELSQRRCGCPLERLGWTTHLHHLRSFEKLTAAGMTFLDADVVRVLEEVLPGRFGGGPTHYQLVERESAAGGAALELVVDPSVGPVDPELLAGAFLEAISSGPGVERAMREVWRTPGLLRVVRQPPHRTGSGKVLHLHHVRGEAEPTASR